jgi:hypothetical protein
MIIFQTNASFYYEDYNVSICIDEIDDFEISYTQT